MTNHVCYICHEVKLLSEFSPIKIRTKRWHCRKCHSRKSYTPSNKLYRSRIVNARRLGVQVTVRKLKEATPCSRCRGYFPYYVMDYDHRDPSTKKGDIGRLVASRTLSVVLAEIAKCDLLCANCHRIKTHSHRDK